MLQQVAVPKCAHTALGVVSQEHPKLWVQPQFPHSSGEVAVCPSVANPSWKDRYHAQGELLGINVTGRKETLIHLSKTLLIFSVLNQGGKWWGRALSFLRVTHFQLSPSHLRSLCSEGPVSPPFSNSCSPLVLLNTVFL